MLTKPKLNTTITCCGYSSSSLWEVTNLLSPVPESRRRYLPEHHLTSMQRNFLLPIFNSISAVVESWLRRIWLKCAQFQIKTAPSAITSWMSENMVLGSHIPAIGIGKDLPRTALFIFYSKMALPTVFPERNNNLLIALRKKRFTLWRCERMFVFNNKIITSETALRKKRQVPRSCVSLLTPCSINTARGELTRGAHIRYSFLMVIKAQSKPIRSPLTGMWLTTRKKEQEENIYSINYSYLSKFT